MITPTIVECAQPSSSKIDPSAFVSDINVTGYNTNEDVKLDEHVSCFHVSHGWLANLLLHYLPVQLILSECRIYASINRVSIGSDNGLSNRSHAIIQTEAGFLSIGTFEANFREILFKTPNFDSRNTSEYIFCKMAATLCRERWVDIMYKRHFVTYKIVFVYTPEIPFERKLNL